MYYFSITAISAFSIFSQFDKHKNTTECRLRMLRKAPGVHHLQINIQHLKCILTQVVYQQTDDS